MPVRLLLLVLLCTCAAADDVQFLRAAPETAEAVSLLGCCPAVMAA